VSLIGKAPAGWERFRKEIAMKKIADRKLQLSRETVRQLDTKTLEQIRGGEVYETIVRPSDACGTPTGH
jgi:hypothetical protein